MTVPFLSPGQTDDAVPRMKKLLVPELTGLGLNALAQKIAVDSKTYGPTAVEGVKKFQAAKHLDVDGFVGKDTWGALGVDEPVTNPTPVVNPDENHHDGQVVVVAGANAPGRGRLPPPARCGSLIRLKLSTTGGRMRYPNATNAS